MADVVEDLADRRVFFLDDAAWSEFCALLGRPARFKPELAALPDGPPTFEAD